MKMTNRMREEIEGRWPTMAHCGQFPAYSGDEDDEWWPPANCFEATDEWFNAVLLGEADELLDWPED
jgi:hypothetical protein